MSISELTQARARPEPLPPQIDGVQPGGGTGRDLEMAWGRLRRWYLKRFRPAYVRRMAELRQGTTTGSPHEILDPRDLKYCRNVVECFWRDEDDPFRWRRRLPLARWGAAELVLIGTPLLAIAGGLATAAVTISPWLWPLVLVPGVPAALVFWFFRDPPRRVAQAPGALVSPADGRVVEVVKVDHDEYLSGPAVRIGIFLSIFNVHVNRAPSACRVVGMRYTPGRFLNAMGPRSAEENENMWIGLEENEPPHRRLAVRVISGAVARRIVCDLRPDESLRRGERFGMIKLGSRTELILPHTEDLQVEVEVGRRVKAGSSILARWPARSEGS